MKKLLFMAALAGFALTSCTNDHEEDTVNKNEPQKITFASPVMYGHTRANIVDAEQGGPTGSHLPYDMRETFRVFGATYTTSDNSVDWSTNAVYGEGAGEIAYYNQYLKGWDTQTPHFWEASKLYTFAAYSPAEIADDCNSTEPTINDKGLKIPAYTTPAMGQQYDLMYAPAVYNKTSSSIETPNADQYNGVNLVFKHALSSVHFKVGVHPDYLKTIVGDKATEANKFNIKSITITGVAATGAFDEKASTNSETGAALDYVAHVDATGYDHWNPSGTAGDYEFVNAPFTLSYTSEDENKTYDKVAKDLQEINAENHIGFMIPQALTNAATITIKWAYDSADQTDVVLRLNGNDINSITEAWKMGKRYTYTIMFSKNRIYFAPQVSDWTDDNPTTPNAPIVIQ